MGFAVNPAKAGFAQGPMQITLDVHFDYYSVFNERRAAFAGGIVEP